MQGEGNRPGEVRVSPKKFMQEEVDKIVEWAVEWKMVINASKTKTLIISKSENGRKEITGIMVEGRELESVDQMKFLG